MAVTPFDVKIRPGQRGLFDSGFTQDVTAVNGATHAGEGTRFGFLAHGLRVRALAANTVPVFVSLNGSDDLTKLDPGDKNEYITPGFVAIGFWARAGAAGQIVRVEAW